MGRKPLLEIYAAAVTLALLYFVVRESSPTFAGVQCNCASRSSPRLSTDNSSSRDFAQHDHNRQYRNHDDDDALSLRTISHEGSSGDFAYNNQHQHHNNQSPASLSLDENASSRAVATFPIRTHILSHGRSRTATTLLFNMATVSYFLYFLGDENNDNDDPNNNRASELQMAYSSRLKNVMKYLHETEPWVVKTHAKGLEDYVTNNTVIFTTAMNRMEALQTKERLSRGGHAVAFVQDMETLKEFGSAGLVPAYIAGFGLSSRDRTNMIEYFSHWEILRQCCGKQMSKSWRNDLWPEELKVRKMPHHPTCPNYDMDVVERAFMDTELYSLIDRYPNMRRMNRPSILDGSLNGTYCSSYSHLVHTEGLSFWGVPKKTKLDESIGQQFKLGTKQLTLEGATVLRNSTREEVWAKPTKYKKKWLKTLQLSRERFKLDTTASTRERLASLRNSTGRKEVQATVEKQDRRETLQSMPPN